MTAEWKDDSAPFFSLDQNTMYFVNREYAVKHLQNVHSDLDRRKRQKHGKSLEVPLIDNVAGIGKSAFAANYINKCRETWPDKERRTEFQDSLCQCHTIHIAFSYGELASHRYDIDALDNAIVNVMIDELQNKFKASPAVLSNPPLSSNAFLRALVREAGPLFIALDGIGAAFERANLSESEKRRLFYFFVEHVIGSWFFLPGIYFLLLGRASFLSLVGLRPNNQILPQSPYSFVRLSLNVLRVYAIEQIIQHTFYRVPDLSFAGDQSPVTIQEYFHLSSSDVKGIAERLFFQTNGNPRELWNALYGCQTVHELQNYILFKDFEASTEFYNRLNTNRDPIMALLMASVSGQTIDLTANHFDADGRSISLDIIANDARIAWEGEPDNARLCVPPKIIQFLFEAAASLQAFLQELARGTKIPWEFACAWEIIILKRFQELFATERCARFAAPDFFDTPKFGACQGIRLAQTIQMSPKITNQTNEVWPNLRSEFAHPDFWPDLLEQMLAWDNGIGCFKPRTMSSSSDGFFTSYHNLGGYLHGIVIGLAVKNFAGTSNFTTTHLKEECAKFNRMFIGPPRKNLLRVLIVAATQYDDTFVKSFQGKKCLFFPNSDPQLSSVQQKVLQHECIDEVILLDLSSIEKIASFLGLDANSELMSAIRMVLEKDESKTV